MCGVPATALARGWKEECSCTHVWGDRSSQGRPVGARRPLSLGDRAELGAAERDLTASGKGKGALKGW